MLTRVLLHTRDTHVSHLHAVLTHDDVRDCHHADQWWTRLGPRERLLSICSHTCPNPNLLGILSTNHRLRVSFTYSCSWSLTCVEIYCILCSGITMKLLPDYPFMWQISSWLMKKSLVISFWNIFSKYSVKSEHFNNSRFKPDFSVATTSILQNILHNNDN